MKPKKSAVVYAHNNLEVIVRPGKTKLGKRFDRFKITSPTERIQAVEYDHDKVKGLLKMWRAIRDGEIEHDEILTGDRNPFPHNTFEEVRSYRIKSALGKFDSKTSLVIAAFKNGKLHAVHSDSMSPSWAVNKDDIKLLAHALKNYKRDLK